MKKYGTKFLAVLMAVIMVFSCMTIPASAFVLEAAAIVGAVATFNTVYDCLSNLGELYHLSADQLLDSISSDIYGQTSTYLWVGDMAMLQNPGSRIEVSRTGLENIALDWRNNYFDPDNGAVNFNCSLSTILIDGIEYTAVRLLPYGIAGSAADVNGKQWFLADGSGRIFVSTEVPDTAGQWLDKQYMKSPYNMLTMADLYTIAKGEGGKIQKSGNMYFIYDPTGTKVLTHQTMPYAAWANDDSAAVNQDRPTTSGTATDSTGNVTNIEGDADYSTNINMNGGTVTFPDGVIEELNNVIYDESTKTYYVDSRDYSTTYNQTFSFYTYHINYTSVTYIGQTEEYNKYYEVYYELPDGRDSADLTDEDLERLSLSFKDVVNYARSTDNVNQRVLYHFDGDVEDSSYWSYCTKFDWTTGASLTYMDEGVFNGSLYLDETEHDFMISLPGNDAAGDYTLQFRYYQSYTAAPQKDSYLYIGDEVVMSFNGGSYFDMNGAEITSTSIGAWNEICIIRSSNTLYYYINGVFYKSVADNAYHKPTIRFQFGNKQQTYKKLDELRFTKAVVYTPGEDYTVSSVPFDSNLALILPDGERPMADEVLIVNPAENNLFNSVGLADWTLDSTLSKVKEAPLVPSNFSSSNRQLALVYKDAGISLYRNSSYTGLTFDIDRIGMTTVGTDSRGAYLSKINPGLSNGLFLPAIGWWRYDYEQTWDDGTTDVYDHYGYPYYLYTQGTTYTLSVVLADGTYSSVSFVVAQNRSGYPGITLSNEYTGSCIDFVSTSLSYYPWNDEDFHNVGIGIVPTTLSAEIVYMELVEGTDPQFTLDWESAVYPASQLEDSPVIAIRSNTPVTKWQFGGVRPSYPEYGMIYAMVESGRISSMQQYTGYAWESVDGRIWTGERWIPYYAYDVFLLKDLFDVVGVDPEKEYIYTESGFWTWLQSAWKGMISRLDAIIEGINALADGKGDSSGDSSQDNPDETPGADTGTDLDKLPGVPDDETTAEDESWNIVDLFVIVKDGTWSLITGVVKTGFDGVSKMIVSFGSITDYFDMYTSSNPAGVQGMFNYGGVDIWD